MVARQSAPLLRNGGFTYLGLLFVVAIMSTALASTGLVWHTAQQREREQELLFVGDQFQKAIGAYYRAGPGALKRYPANLEELLEDRRQRVMRRHLRKLYRDPITRNAEWGLVRSSDGGIMGVYSLSDGDPIRQARFLPEYRLFASATSYSDWKFVYGTAK